jgi:hypothetical protein
MSPADGGERFVETHLTSVVAPDFDLVNDDFLTFAHAMIFGTDFVFQHVILFAGTSENRA